MPQYVYGGVQGKNNVRNARFHQGNKYIFTTDLKSFFPTISHKQVFSNVSSRRLYVYHSKYVNKIDYS